MYLDANFFIFSNVTTDARGDRARKILREIVAGKHAVTSVLALDEVLWVLRKNKRGGESRPVLEWIYSIPNLEVREAPALIPLRAVDFIEQHGLRPRDAFHVAIMEHFSIREIVTDDADFDNLPGIKRVAL